MKFPKFPTLSSYVARSGIASRRKAADLIKKGCVEVNGQKTIEPGYRVQVHDEVTMNGRKLEPVSAFHYVLLNKPRGYVSTNEDRYAQKKAVDLIDLPDAPRLFSAGRLDKESEGLLIFSDDGDYVEKLTHPRYNVLKRYEVELSRPLTDAELNALRAGIADDGEFLKPREVRPLGGRRYEFTLNEGKKREIRRLTAHFGAPTVRLCRISMGNLSLGDLPTGGFRELTGEEVGQSLTASPED